MTQLGGTRPQKELLVLSSWIVLVPDGSPQGSRPQVYDHTRGTVSMVFFVCPNPSSVWPSVEGFKDWISA